MEFKIKFCTRPEQYIAPTAHGKKIFALGLDWLDQAREMIGLPDLPANWVSSVVAVRDFNPEITISENLARESGHFRGCCNVVVLVPGESFNEYLYIAPEVHRTEIDEVVFVNPVWEIDEPLILADWIMAGYPLEWGPGKE